MSEHGTTEFLNLRLPLYAYAAPLWRGRRVLEIGCGDGGSAEYLAGHGAESVLAVDQDAARVARARARHARARAEFRLVSDLGRPAGSADRFDVVLVPEGQALLAAPAVLAALRGLLAEGGHLVLAVPSADRRNRGPVKEGVGYYDLADTLAAQFPVVRMLGQTPFLGFGLVEFDGSADTLHVDISLLQGSTEPPSHYIAVAGAAPPRALGYSLVQVPFAPVESVVLGSMTSRSSAASPPPDLPSRQADQARVAALSAEVSRLGEELQGARAAAGRAGANGSGGAEARAELAERRLDEAERRARVRLDEAESRLLDLRGKLDEALGKAESAARVSRAQSDEIDELRARLRRAAEDRAAIDVEMSRLRRALSEADEAVLVLTRRAAEEIAAVSGKLGSGPGGADGVAPGDLVEARARQAEEAAARGRAELAALAERLRAAEQRANNLARAHADLEDRDERVARLEGDKQDLLWRVAELEQRSRATEADLAAPSASLTASFEELAATGDQSARPSSWTMVELNRGAAAQLDELRELQASLGEHTALVAELEDSLRVAEVRAVAAEADAASLRRSARELAEADRARRGRLAELEGKLLRLERERAEAANQKAAGSTGPTETAAGELGNKLRAAEQRALAAEQRAVAAEQRAVAAEEWGRDAEARAVAAEERAGVAEARAVAAEEWGRDAEARATAAEDRAGVAEARAIAVEERLGLSAEIPSVFLGSADEPTGSNGTHPAATTSEGLAEAVRQIEQRLGDEMRTLSEIEARLELARAEAAGGGGGPRGQDQARRAPGSGTPDDRADLEHALAIKDSELVEGRLELARLRRDSEARQAQLEAEISELRARRPGQAGAAPPVEDQDQDQAAQLLLMHSTLANIRRRSARLRDELEGFRRRLDTLPPGALASMLEEIGEDLAEFAK